MSDRLKLHSELLTFLPNVYFQPPSTITMKYPCIVYRKTTPNREFGNNKIYLKKQGYQVTVMENNPDSDIPDRLEEYFEYCGIDQHYTINNLNHTTLSLYY